jgi:hypothetical protein
VNEYLCGCAPPSALQRHLCSPPSSFSPAPQTYSFSTSQPRNSEEFSTATMGGKTFADVQVPRMLPAVYRQLSKEFQSKLETAFHRVTIPRDAPDKADYGDIDYLVEGVKAPVSSSDDVWSEVKKLLGADRHHRNGCSHSFAVPHPEIIGAFVQVDVELCPGNDTPDGAELFDWTRFMKSDSDLLQIIGISHRSLGILSNDKGLHIRVEEIEPYNKKKSHLFLTRSPDKAMEFLGLDTAKYWAGFSDETDLFDWATSGRFFSSTIFEKRVETSNDRSRKAKRPMYSRFVEEYMPAHTDKNGSVTWTRQQVLQEAIEVFDKQAEYNIMMEVHKFKEEEEGLWQEIREVVPAEGNSLTMAMKGLRRWVGFLDGKPHIATEPDLEDKPMWTKLMAPGSKESLLSWVKDHWEEAKVAEKARAAAAKAAAAIVGAEGIA